MSLDLAISVALSICIALLTYFLNRLMDATKREREMNDTRFLSVENKVKEVDQKYNAQSESFNHWRQTLPETYARRDDVAAAMNRVERILERVEDKIDNFTHNH